MLINFQLYQIMSTLFFQALYIIFILVTLLWVFSAIIKNVSIVDLFWGMGLVIVNAVYFYNSGELFQRKILLLILVTLWGLRLSINLAWRNLGIRFKSQLANFEISLIL